MSQKRITIITFFCLVQLTMFTKTLIAQSDEDQVQSTLNKYLKGTSYNEPEVIAGAFYEDALLFLSHKEKPLHIMTIKEYASLFEKKERGTFNGRTGKVLNIDIENDIAQAKAAIFIEGSNHSYIDIFLLKKLKGGWKIISKAATVKK